MSAHEPTEALRSDARAGAFDAFADNYQQTLAKGLAASGEAPTYFAEKRVAWLAERLRMLGVRPRTGLDFGCGTGSSTPFLLSLGLESLLGVDVSERSIEEAERTHGQPGARFLPLASHEPRADLDLAFCNGVFHHIPPAERAQAVSLVARSLKPGGLWSFWENNPLNPGTRWVMWRLPFDRDAITLTAREATRMLKAGGFEVLAVDHLFLFPRALRALRGLERHAMRLPLGAQYQVLCRKPG